MASAVDPPASPDRYRRYRAPREDNQALIDPPDLLALVEANRAAFAERGLDLNGRGLQALANAARRRMFDLAYDATRAYCDVDVEPSDSLIVSGHQPELFHSGVWLKNQVLDRVAKRAGAVGVHLVIDSDQCRGTSLRVPAGSVDHPRWEAVAYDRSAPDRPYEERVVLDRDCFTSFARRVAETLGGLLPDPMVRAMWPDAIAAMESGCTLGESLSRSRRLVEQRWGSRALELPFSTLCETHEVRWALAFVLAELPRVHAAYNAALADYRAAHQLRSPAQPLPDLSRDDDWLEAPLWVWTTDDPVRRPLFVRRREDGLALTNRAGGEWLLPHVGDQSLDDAVDRLGDLRKAGVKLRPRALVTTLLARLLLGDLFLHGIGGAKYDQVTDDLCRRWLGFAPPPHATVTATLRLPIDHPPASEQMATQLRVRLRELEFHPERFVESPSPAAAEAMATKKAAVALPSRGWHVPDRHQQIVSANKALQALVGDKKKETEKQLMAANASLQASTVLDSRECSFCLFPEEDLRRRYDQLLSND